MYAWLYRHLPGPTWLRVVIAVLLLIAVILLLMQVVFPTVERLLPFSNVAVE